MHAPLPAAVLRKLACDGECSRNCVCCGAPTPTKSMCARWPHWMALPETLRSEILKSYGRDEFANYRRNIDKAIGTWRQLGVWRVRSEGAGQPATATQRASVALRVALSIDGIEFRQTQAK